TCRYYSGILVRRWHLSAERRRFVCHRRPSDRTSRRCTPNHMAVASVPPYAQAERQQILQRARGRWTAGSAGPSEAAAPQRRAVSRRALVRSLQDLVRDGYVYRRQGKGTFVAERPPRPRQQAAELNTARSVPVFVSAHTAALSGDARDVL